MLVSGRTGVGKSTLLGVLTGLVPRVHRRHAARATSCSTARASSTCRRASARTSSATSARTRSPASSPTRSRRSSPTAWSSSACRAGHDAPPGRGDARPARHRRPARPRPAHACPGGQQQRVAIGAVLTTHPRLLVLDEPTSALDPTAAEDVLATLTRLVHDLGLTVLLAEHRLERVRAVRRPDRPAHRRRRASASASPAAVLADLPGGAADHRAGPRWPAGRRCR